VGLGENVTISLTDTVLGGMYGCPESFSLMTVSWYINHSKNPNVGCDEHYKFVALRDIREGEELTADYNSYNEFATAEWV
jgi:hypothetical protein